MKASQCQNANDVYFAHLAGHDQKGQDYIPIFFYADGSKKANRIKGNQWDDTMLHMEIDVHDEDLEVIKIPWLHPMTYRIT